MIGLRFRQVELELEDADAKIVGKVTARLERAGLLAETAPKFGTAMGLPVPPATQAGLGNDSALGDVVAAVVTQGLARLLDHDWRLRSAVHRTAPEDIHQARVASRRLRSDVRTFDVVLDPIWVKHVRNDLKWLGSALGRARDVDVLDDQLEGAPEELHLQLTRERDGADEQISTVLSSDRYLLLLDRLHAAADHPPFVIGEDGIRGEDKAREVLPVVVGARWRALRRQVRKAGAHPSDQCLHRIRIKSKQLRYAAEAAVPVIGKPARRTATAAEKLQTVLGEHHDAVTAESWLRGGGTARHLLRQRLRGRSHGGEQHRRQRKLRHRWRRTWKPLVPPKRTRWWR